MQPLLGQTAGLDVRQAWPELRQTCSIYRGRVMWRPRLSPIALAAASAAAAVLVWIVAYYAHAARRADATVFAALSEAGIPQLRPQLEKIALLASPRSFVLIGLALTAVALLRRRRQLAAVVALMLVAANATTQGLQHLIPHLVERPPGGSAEAMAWPSGHATAAMSLALCAVLVASPRLRPAAAMLGAGYAVAVGYAQIALGAHMPSDVLGGYLIAAAFVLLAVAAMRALESGRRAQTASRGHFARSVASPAIGALGVLLAACAAVLLKDPAAAGLAQNIPALAAGSSIAALGVMLIAGLGMSLRA
jgi:membrane-associated phospholipid phosphatase